MSGNLNLAASIEKQLPAEMVDVIRVAGEVAARGRQRLYLVGGVVRDLLLGRPNLDLDLVVDSDATGLARRLAAVTGASITVHTRFNTAKLSWSRWSADLATVRAETYDRPGALPRTGPGTLETDMFRRDFTINALAIELTAERYGQFIDLHGGRADLEKRIIRVLHENSFVDDATRIWRAIRYEQRLGFHLERRTKRWLVRNIPMLETISGDRIRHELELVLKEERPEKALRRAGELGVLTKLHPSLKVDNWLASKFRQIRRTPGSVSEELYLALLCYRLSPADADRLIAYLKLSRRTARVIKDTNGIRNTGEALAAEGLSHSGIYNLLKGCANTAIVANQIAADSALVKKRMSLYLSKLRQVRAVLTGDDLQKMGIPPGPRMKEILQELLEARLDGKVTGSEEEVAMVEKLLGPN